MNKTIVSYLFMILLMLGCSGCGKIEIEPKEMQVELGDALSQNILDYVSVNPSQEENLQEEAILNIKNVSTVRVGVYEAIVTYKDQKIYVPISVVDTTAPSVIPGSNTFESGERVTAEDLVKVYDYSDVTLNFISVYDNGTYGREYDEGMATAGTTFVVKAVDTYGNETILEVVPKVVKKKETEKAEEVVEEEIEETEEFPNGCLICADDVAYEYIKEAYGKVDWTCEFETGDAELYEAYKEKYKALLNNEVQYLEAANEWIEDEYKYLYDGIGIEEDLLPENVFTGDHDTYSLLYFDMDLDGGPELCITENITEDGQGVRTHYLFKYDEEKDEIVMYDWVGGSYMHIIGSGKWEWDHYNLNGFSECDENGDWEVWVEFWEEEDYACDTTNYLVALPQYQGTQLEIPDEILEQGYYSDDEQYFWAVTEEQFKELTADYYEVCEEAIEKRKEVIYTYTELFGYRNAMQYVKDGMKNSDITDFYSRDIEEIQKVFSNKSIEILYYPVDLNGDGWEDMLVYLKSAYHSGASGDSFRILINEGGPYRELKQYYTVKLYNHNGQSTETGCMYILDSETNGYRDIEITTLDGVHFYLRYDGETYQHHIK